MYVWVYICIFAQIFTEEMGEENFVFYFYFSIFFDVFISYSPAVVKWFALRSNFGMARVRLFVRPACEIMENFFF